MSLPPRNPDHRSPKRQRFPPPVPEEDEEEDDDYSAASIDDEDEEDEEDYTDESADEAGGDEEVADDVGVTRMATIGNEFGDTVTEAQPRRSVSSSPSSSSSHQSVKLKSSEILDCPTCYEPLKRPIYQCTNGHLTCGVCCSRVKRKCPFCRLPIGDIRCRAMEKVIEASIVPCRHAIYGCKETFPYGTQAKHEKLCLYVRCLCPYPNCNYGGAYKDVENHARASHSWDAENLVPFVFDSPQIFSMNLAKKKTTVFQEEKEGDLVVVQAFKGTRGGVCVTVNRIAPMSPGLRNLSCSLAKLSAYTTLRLGLLVEKIQKVREQEEPKYDFMFIPDYMLSGDHLKLQICIGSEYKPNCEYTGVYKDLYSHYYANHHKDKEMWNCFVCGRSSGAWIPTSKKILILQESSDGPSVVLQCFNEPQGLYVTVNCVAPCAPGVGRYSYRLSYTFGDATMTLICVRGDE